MKKQNNNGVWNRLFHEGYSPEWYALLKASAGRATDNFLRGVRDINPHFDLEDSLTPESNDPILDAWVEQNDDLLGRLAEDIQTHITSVLQFALPAHDERQILFKDAAEGLRFSAMENLDGYKATFIIPMFAHDIGRLLEGRFFHPDNPHDNWTPHSQFSFLLLKEILDKDDYALMPQKLKNHFLYAVLQHSGDNGKSYMSRAVQTCDRMQLIGAEGFFRALSYGVCLMGSHIKYPADKSYDTQLPSMFEHRSVISMMEYCARNMRQNIGDSHVDWQGQVAIENVALLMMACDGNDDLCNRIFAPEMNPHTHFEPTKKPLPDYILAWAKDIYLDHKDRYERRSSPFEVKDAIIKSLQSPMGAAQLTPAMQVSVQRAVSDMSEVERTSLYQTICMADELRAKQDDFDFQICRGMVYSLRSFDRVIANKVLAYQPQAAHQPTSPSALDNIYGPQPHIF